MQSLHGRTSTSKHWRQNVFLVVLLFGSNLYCYMTALCWMTDRAIDFPALLFYLNFYYPCISYFPRFIYMLLSVNVRGLWTDCVLEWELSLFVDCNTTCGLFNCGGYQANDVYYAVGKSPVEICNLRFKC